MNRSAFLAGLGATALPFPARAATLYDRVHAIARSVPGAVGIVCRRIDAPEPVFAYNPDMTFPTASTIKVLIMATAYAMEERYPGTLDQTIVTHRKDLVSGSDFLSQQPDGARFSVRQLIVPMITLSDNTAANYLISFFDFTTIAAMGRRAGLSHTHLERHFMDFSAIVLHNDNTTTPRDMAKLLAEIARGARGSASETPPIATQAHCRDMIRIMLRQTDREGIPAGLPRGTPVANKTGVLVGVRNDIAIVEPFGDDPYVLSVYTKWLEHATPAYLAMRRAARLSFEELGG